MVVILSKKCINFVHCNISCLHFSSHQSSYPNIWYSAFRCLLSTTIYYYYTYTTYTNDNVTIVHIKHKIVTNYIIYCSNVILVRMRYLT